MNENGADLAPTEGEPLPAEPEAGTVDPAAEWEPGPVETPEQPLMAEAPDAAAEIQDPGIEKLDWREYLETYQNNWQDGETQNDDRAPAGDGKQAHPANLARRPSDVAARLSALDDDDQRIGATIIYNLDDDGYLETPVAELATQLETSVERVERVLKQVQRLDPPGVGARDLRECLFAQLRNLGMEESLAARVVLHHLDLLEKHRYNEIAKELGVPLDMVREAAKMISLLEPKPGRDYGGAEPTYIVPDVYIQKVGDDFVVTLNESAVPRLRLASYYQRVLNDGAVATQTKEYLQERMRSARCWSSRSFNASRRSPRWPIRLSSSSANSLSTASAI